MTTTIKEYKDKHDFKSTSRPDGMEKSSAHEKLIFVVQKHKASTLHYDFRLELGGVLKSWAVPKGPTLDTNAKRLAVMVEDHPISYANFEGEIPSGSYGAGEVIVWDTGTYHSSELEGSEAKDVELNTKKLKSDLRKGIIKITLKGKKLKGNFLLMKLKNVKTGKSWILVKEEDKYATRADITADNRSVISKRKL